MELKCFSPFKKLIKANCNLSWFNSSNCRIQRSNTDSFTIKFFGFLRQIDRNWNAQTGSVGTNTFNEIELAQSSGSNNWLDLRIKIRTSKTIFQWYNHPNKTIFMFREWAIRPQNMRYMWLVFLRKRVSILKSLGED